MDLVIDSATSAFDQVSFNSSNGELLGYSNSVGNDLPATCSPAYGELCPLDRAADLVGLQFAGSYNGYTLDIDNAVLLDSADSPNELGCIFY